MYFLLNLLSVFISYKQWFEKVLAYVKNAYYWIRQFFLYYMIASLKMHISVTQLYRLYSRIIQTSNQYITFIIPFLKDIQLGLVWGVWENVENSGNFLFLHALFLKRKLGWIPQLLFVLYIFEWILSRALKWYHVQSSCTDGCQDKLSQHRTYDPVHSS